MKGHTLSRELLLIWQNRQMRSHQADMVTANWLSSPGGEDTTDGINRSRQTRRGQIRHALFRKTNPPGVSSRTGR
jgi:hypothetical protein